MIGVIRVSVRSDVIDEANETFDLVKPTNAALVNDDPVPTIAIKNALRSRHAGHIHSEPLQPRPRAGDGQFVTADGTATAVVFTPTNTCIGDYFATSGTRAFTNGQTLQTISVSVVADGYRDSAELVFVNLATPTNAMIADGQGVGTILEHLIGIFTLTPADTGHETGDQPQTNRAAVEDGENWRVVEVGPPAMLFDTPTTACGYADLGSVWNSGAHYLPDWCSGVGAVRGPGMPRAGRAAHDHRMPAAVAGGIGRADHGAAAR